MYCILICSVYLYIYTSEIISETLDFIVMYFKCYQLLMRMSSFFSFLLVTLMINSCLLPSGSCLTIAVLFPPGHNGILNKSLWNKPHSSILFIFFFFFTALRWHVVFFLFFFTVANVILLLPLDIAFNKWFLGNLKTKKNSLLEYWFFYFFI